LTGFDDIALSSLVSPRLTTVAVDKQCLGRHAWELFTDSARDEPRGRTVTVAPHLIVRGSTAD
jgi:DNA-binding LacI/PurR family transcriptional regulator